LGINIIRENTMADPEMVTIPIGEYLSLKDDERWRECMEAEGVDNWIGYGYAMEAYYEGD
jgi:hypothetical protein